MRHNFQPDTRPIGVSSGQCRHLTAYHHSPIALRERFTITCTVHSAYVCIIHTYARQRTMWVGDLMQVPLLATYHGPPG